MKPATLISIVSPVYGCRDCLQALSDAVAAALRESGLEWELVLVDDRAPDDPWPMIRGLAQRDRRIRGVRLSRNHGQHLAIWAGLEAARGEWVVVLDCDLQDDPAIIPRLLDKALAEGSDAVVVDRGEWSDTGFRRRASQLFYRVMETLGGLKLNNNIGNFGIYSRRLVDVLLRFRDKEVFLPVMVALTGLPVTTLSLDRSARQIGRSSYNLSRLIRMAGAIVIRFSDRPLKLSVVLGAALSGFAALFSVVLLLAWATGAFSVPGWTSLILSVWFLAGLILAVLGVHGVYIGRIFAEVQDRPRILVEQTTDGEDMRDAGERAGRG
ncbi:glycosyltransferase family 2 protein [Enterovirga sp.]|uniref:glycosyltransferase family 2 protein n=1 Tax=Enterovirga sp. TaxID=2026350 RepID=UPI002B805FA8|nr:glycosyltransferase family 2 protein [Enterovirga sp.]HMO29828.1 glycosyltransferase family 2 protein [Enterovirga sp.]